VSTKDGDDEVNVCIDPELFPIRTYVNQLYSSLIESPTQLEVTLV
jgi:hypothetical protein